VETAEGRLPVKTLAAELSWRMAIERAVDATLVVIDSELRQLFLQVVRVPEQDVVEILSAYGPDQSLYDPISRSTKG
jgi:hypothetical protein